MMVNEVCTIHLSIGRHHQDEIHCDVVDMTTCHLLLGKPWQFDRNGKTTLIHFVGKKRRLLWFQSETKSVNPYRDKKDKSPNSERKGIWTTLIEGKRSGSVNGYAKQRGLLKYSTRTSTFAAKV